MNKDIRIFTPCPACGFTTLTINHDNRLLCTWFECPDPTLMNRIGQMAPRSPIEAQLCELAAANFKRDLASRLKKAGEEFSELAEAIVNGDPIKIGEEAADVSFVLMDICQIAGRSLSEEQRMKFKKLLERQAAGLLHKEVRIAKGVA